MLKDGLPAAFLLVHLLLGSEVNVCLGIALHAACDHLCSETAEMQSQSVRS